MKNIVQKDLIKLDFKKAKDNYEGLDWCDKNEIEDIINLYVKKEPDFIEGYNYSVFLEYSNSRIVPYLKHDLKEIHIKKMI